MQARKEKIKRIRKRQNEKGMFLSPSPFAGIDPEALRAALGEAGTKLAAEFPDLLQEVVDLLHCGYPPHIIATLSVYALSVPVSRYDGVATKSFMPEIEQHQIEVLQALSLTLPWSAWQGPPASPQIIQSIVDKLPKLCSAFTDRRLQQILTERDDVSNTIISLQERMRIHTQSVRNWGYLQDVIRLSKKLYSPIDPLLSERYGFTATQLIDTAQYIKISREEKLNAWMRGMRRTFREHKIDNVLKSYYKAFPRVGRSYEEFRSAFDGYTEVTDVKARLVAHSEIFFVEISTLFPDTISRDTGVPLNTVTSILNTLSEEPEGLSQINKEHIFLANPIWLKPAIKIGDVYFMPSPHMVFSHVHAIFRALCDVNNEMKAALERQRATFLEAEIASIVEKYVDKGNIRKNCTWQWDGATYETDLIALVDRSVFIFEAKSAALTAQALRGAPDRVKRHVEDLVLAPSIQSQRLENLIRLAATNNSQAQSVLTGLGIDARIVDNVIRVSVTIDDFSVLAAAEGDFKRIGWVDQRYDLAPVVGIADLHVIFDLLERPVYIGHYLLERSRSQKSVDIFGDEMDQLGFYLQTGYNFARSEEDQLRLSVSGMSQRIDVYYESKFTGVSISKPKPRLDPYFVKIIEFLELRKREGWLSIGLDVLRSASFSEQVRISRMLERLRKSVPREFRDPEHICSVVVQPPRIRAASLILYVFRRADADKRSEIMDNLAVKYFEENADQDRCIVIARMVEEWEQPYHTIGVWFRHSNASILSQAANLARAIEF